MGLARASACLLFALVLCAAAPPPSPTDSVKVTITEVLGILADAGLKQPARKDERRSRLETVVSKRFDYEEMSKRTLAGQWRQRSEAERRAFVEAFRNFISAVYGGKIEYAGEQVEYLGERREGDYAEVRTRIVSDKVTVPMDYRLLQKDGDWRVYDVVADGISLVKNYRGQFDKVIRESSFDALLDRLRNKSDDIKPPQKN